MNYIMAQNIQTTLDVLAGKKLDNIILVYIISNTALFSHGWVSGSITVIIVKITAITASVSTAERDRF